MARQASAGRSAEAPELVDPRTEAWLLGSCLADPKWVGEVVGIVEGVAWSREAHARIWAAIRAVHDRGEGVDTVSVGDELRREGLLEAVGGLTRLAELEEGLPAVGQPLAWAKRLRALDGRRREVEGLQAQLEARLRAPLELEAPATGRVVRYGLGYRLQRNGLTLSLSRVRESRGEVTGELGVTYGGQPLARFRWNVSSLTARKTAVSYLAQRHKEDWVDLLERFANEVLELWHRGSSFCLIGPDDPVDAPEPMRLRPLIWEKGATLMFGRGGTGKSTLAAAMAVSVATGREVVPGWVPESAPVLILDWEDGVEEWRYQIRAICLGSGIEMPWLHYRQMAVPLSDEVESIAEYCDEHGIGLVVVDSVEPASGSGEGEDYTGRAERLFDALRLIDASALLIDHVSGAALGSEEAVAKPIGGVRKMDRARAVYEVRAEREPVGGKMELLVRDAKRNRRRAQSPMGVRVEFGEVDVHGRAKWIRFSRTQVEAVELEALLPVVDRVDRWLRKMGSRSPKEVAAELRLEPRMVEQALRRGVMQGRLVAFPDGSYGSLYKGEMAAEEEEEMEASKVEEVMEVLRRVLADGPVPARRVISEVRAATGCSERTIYQAKTALKVDSVRHGEPGERGVGEWSWRLPGI